MRGDVSEVANKGGDEGEAARGCRGDEREVEPTEIADDAGAMAMSRRRTRGGDEETRGTYTAETKVEVGEEMPCGASSPSPATSLPHSRVRRGQGADGE